MTETIIMRGAYVITDPRLGASGVIQAGAVVIAEGTIRETGPFAAIAPKYPGTGVIGDGTQLLMPGLVDAHSHGRGLSPIQKGVRNDFLENALFDYNWRVGDLVLWDNRCTMHRRGPFDPAARRVMHRTQIKGETRPVA